MGSKCPSARLLGIGLFALFVAHEHPAMGADPSGASGESIVFGVRLIKTEGAGLLRWSARLPTQCSGCGLDINPLTSDQNAKEIFFHFHTPQDLIGPIHVHVTTDASKIRALVIGRTDTRILENPNYKVATPFTRQGDGIEFDVPLRVDAPRPDPFDQVDVTSPYTFIETRGVLVRVCHADPALRRGPYASGRWPAKEIKAVLNLEFAVRKAMEELGLPQSLTDMGVEEIELMGFDTNYPTESPDQAHTDWPPHWHVVAHWKKEPQVRKAPHIYIGPDGLLQENFSPVIISDSGQPIRNDPLEYKWYLPGEVDRTTTPEGRLVFSLTVTPDHQLKLGTEAGNCGLLPARHGFDDGVDLACEGHAKIHGIHAIDRLTDGILDLYMEGHRAARYRYDVETGQLKNEETEAAEPE